MRPCCVPCLLRRTLYETELVNRELGPKVIKEATAILAKEYSDDVNSAVVATKVHRRVYEILETDDPYKELKARSNEVAKQLLPKVERLIEDSDDRLRTAILCSITGNVLDFGIGTEYDSPELLFENFEKLCNEGLKIDDTDVARGYLKDGNRILLFADNCGEIVFDKLLCRELKDFEIHLSIVVKGEPILTDATLEDVYGLGIDEVVDDVVTTNSNAVGVDFDSIGDELRYRLRNADLIISKGMANYEAFSDTDFKPILYLLRTKCIAVAEDMGLPKDINVARLIK